MKERLANINWFRYFSPAVLAIIFSVIGVIISLSEMDRSEGWSFIGVIILAPVIGILVVVDFVTKLIFREKTWAVWLIEFIALGLIYLFWFENYLG